MDFKKDVGISTCKLALPLILLVSFLDIHPYFITQCQEYIFRACTWNKAEVENGQGTKFWLFVVWYCQ